MYVVFNEYTIKYCSLISQLGVLGIYLIATSIFFCRYFFDIREVCGWCPRRRAEQSDFPFRGVLTKRITAMLGGFILSTLFLTAR